MQFLQPLRHQTAYRKCGIVTLLVSSVALASESGTLSTGTDKTAKLPFWEWHSDTMSLRLVQRLPDQTRAFFMARGFNQQQAEKIAQSCIFQSVYKNLTNPASERVIEYNLADWEVIHNGESRGLKTREQWLKQWRRENVPKSARIAFEWSLLPTHQRYQAKDYNWGMTAYNLPPGSQFDLVMKWTEDGNEKSARLNNLKCAPDVHLTPKDPFG
jgi:hypothetical protein